MLHTQGSQEWPHETDHHCQACCVPHSSTTQCGSSHFPGMPADPAQNSHSLKDNKNAVNNITQVVHIDYNNDLRP